MFFVFAASELRDAAGSLAAKVHDRDPEGRWFKPGVAAIRSAQLLSRRAKHLTRFCSGEDRPPLKSNQR